MTNNRLFKFFGARRVLCNNIIRVVSAFVFAFVFVKVTTRKHPQEQDRDKK